MHLGDLTFQSMENLQRLRNDGEGDYTSDSTSRAAISTTTSPQSNPMDNRGQWSVGLSFDSVATLANLTSAKQKEHNLNIKVTSVLNLAYLYYPQPQPHCPKFRTSSSNVPTLPVS